MAILTISREIGSGGREIGYKIADLMGYELITKERLLSDIKEWGAKWENWGKILDEHHPTVWEKYDWSFKGFCALMQNQMLQYALKDKVVLLGRGGNFLFNDIPYALRIRIIAPVKYRAERIMKRDSVDIETARWIIEKTDKERSGFIRALYGEDLNALSEYDITFDTSTRPLEGIIASVKAALADKERFNTPNNCEKLRLHALAAKIKAVILTDPTFFIPTLDIDDDGEGLILKGVIHNPKEHKRIEDTVQKLAGDTKVRCKLHYRS
ncbi:MAG: cytidylate kinase family protein [Nitrospirae bacterium]|nr:cytidylate kinase family protein [Nitrospirota bacterium]